MFTKTIQKIREMFHPKKKQQRELKELLRENLGFLSVDVFYIDDPKVGVPPDKRVEYYKKFYDICRDQDVMERIKYLINKQARITLENAKNGEIDQLGGININGMATVKDDFQGLATAYLKETAGMSEEELKKFEGSGKYKVI